MSDNAEAQEREAFEAWFSDGGAYPQACERSGHGYRLMQTQNSWTVWQARAALVKQAAVPAPAEPVATITEIEYDYPWRVNVRFDVAVLAREKRGVVAGAKLYVAPPDVPAERPQGEQA